MWFIWIGLEGVFFQEISSVATQRNFSQRHLLNIRYAHPDTCAQYQVVNRKRRDIDVK
jgi:hypothetical protein